MQTIKFANFLKIHIRCIQILSWFWKQSSLHEENHKVENSNLKKIKTNDIESHMIRIIKLLLHVSEMLRINDELGHNKKYKVEGETILCRFIIIVSLNQASNPNRTESKCVHSNWLCEMFNHFNSIQFIIATLFNLFHSAISFSNFRWNSQIINDTENSAILMQCIQHGIEQ